MRTASEIAKEIDRLSNDLGKSEWAKLEAIRAEVRAGALTDEVVRELYTLEFTYESRHNGDYDVDERDIAVKAGLDPAAHLAWLLKRANRCSEVARFLGSSGCVRTLDGADLWRAPTLSGTAPTRPRDEL